MARATAAAYAYSRRDVVPAARSVTIALPSRMAAPTTTLAWPRSSKPGRGGRAPERRGRFLGRTLERNDELVLCRDVRARGSVGRPPSPPAVALPPLTTLATHESRPLPHGS